LPVLHSQTADGTSELLYNLLTSVLPNIREAKLVAVTISSSQWEEVLWDHEEEGRQLSQEKVEPEGDPDNIYLLFDHVMAVSKWLACKRLHLKFAKALFQSGPAPVNCAPFLSKLPARALCLKGSKQAEPLTARETAFATIS
jgi:hypothetical protein